jgi:hypothetical protein
MFDSQCDLAALVYEMDEDPDEVLRVFAANLTERGFRPVGLVQLGHHCVDGPDMSRRFPLPALTIISVQEPPQVKSIRLGARQNGSSHLVRS